MRVCVTEYAMENSELIKSYIDKKIDENRLRLSARHKMISLQERLLYLIDHNKANKTEIQVVEDEIKKMQIEAELVSKKRELALMEENFKKYLEQYFIDLTSVLNNFTKDFNDLVSKKSKIPTAEQLINSIKWDIVNNSVDSKILLHKEVKKLLGK